MTALLASVTDPQEALLALRGGADIIDLKDPARGALGAVSPAVQRSVIRVIGGRRPVSATVGDLPMSAHVIAAAIQATAATGVDLIKVGLFERYPAPDILNALAAAGAGGIRVAAVLFADQYPPLHLLEPLRRAGCAGVMLDTADKTRGGLAAHLDRDTLAAFVRRGKRLGLLTGLAGSLQAADIPPLVALGPDYLGFRSALCRGGTRTSDLSETAVANIRAQLDAAAHAACPTALPAASTGSPAWTTTRSACGRDGEQA